MEINTIETFLKVAANQNLSKTASQMGYSQSAITVQIQKLEKELGVPLFERIGKRIYLTQKGKDFIPYANEILKATQAAMTFAQEEIKPKGILRIGGVESVCTALLPKFISKFYQLCPDVEVIVRSGATNDLLNLLDSNELDVVLTLDEKINRSELNCLMNVAEDIVFVTGKENSFASKKVSIEELSQEVFILTENKASYRYELERLLSKKNLHIRPILEIGNTETIINLLRQGMGISFLPEFTVQSWICEGVLACIDTDLPSIQMYHQLFCHKGKWMNPQLKIFIEIVKEYFKGKED